jgi:DNA polymerase I-like protein with 3'-5' exonuclease and polymerase domains
MLPPFLTNLDPEVYLSDNYVVVDFEVDTSHGDHGAPIHSDNQLLLARWRVGPDHRDFNRVPAGGSWSGEYEQHELLERVSSADFVVAHHSKYELGWFIRLGIDLRTVLVFDTQLAEYVLLGNLAAGATELGMAPLSTSLDMCSRRRGLPIKDPVVDLMIKDGINPVYIPRPWLEDRCAQDVETTEQIFLDQRGDLQRRGLLGVLYTRSLLTPVLADIEREGMALDPDKVEETHAKYHAELVDLSNQMDQLTGGINWRSPTQAPQFVYDVLKFKELTNKRGEPIRNAVRIRKDGSQMENRKTDKKTLDKLKATTQEQRDFIDLRRRLGKVQAALSKSLDFYLGVVREKAGTFYAELNQTSTATQRLSSTGIPLKFAMFEKPKTTQFQNQPRIFKKLFRAKRKGWSLAEADGSSLEFRVAAELGQDKQAISDIISAWDVHLFTASVLHSVSLDDVRAEKKEAEKAGRDDWRQLAKPDTFKPLYGGQKGTPEQERYYEAFRKRYTDITETQKGWLDEVMLTKRLVTPWGLVYYWPIAKYSSTGWSNVTSSVFNYPIQGFATAEIIPIAIVFFWHRMREAGLEGHCYLVNTVHDSIVAEVEPGYEELFKQVAKQAFTTDVYRYLERVYKLPTFSVPLGVGLKVGSHWGTGDEEQWNIWPDGREERVK